MKLIRKSIVCVAVLLSGNLLSSAFAQKAERKHVREGTYNLGNSLYKQDKLKEATEQYQLLAGQEAKMKETPEGKARLAEIYHNMGNISMKGKDYAQSVEAYKQSLRLNPKDDETRYNLALAQKLLSDQQNEDQSQDQKNEEKQEDKENKDQQQQQQKPDDQKQNKTQEEQQQNEQMSQDNAQQMLDAFLQDEKDTQEKVKKAQQQQQQRRKTEKQW